MLFYIILVLVVCITLPLIQEMYWSMQRERQERQRRKQIEEQRNRIEEAKRAVLQATGDEQITQLMMWLREDLTPRTVDTRYMEKLKEICAKPSLALVAFQAALKSADGNMQYVGIRGLAYLKDMNGITPLMEYYRSENDFRSASAEALIELSPVAPIKGDNGFLTIYKQILETSSYIKWLEILLSGAVKRASEFSDEDFDALVNWSNQYADTLISSGEIERRHAGEDFKKTISSIQARREAVKREQQRQEQLRQEQQVQRERVERERQWQEEKRQERERQERRERQRQERERGRAKDDKTDYYKILQVDSSAEPEVIAGAYRRLAAKYHPDVYREADATPRMQLLNEAYAVLSDPTKRRRYDETRTQSRGAG